MAYLAEKEKSLLFSALTREKKIVKKNGYDELAAIVSGLESKFYYDRYEKEIRAKAVEDTVKEMKNWIVERYSLSEDDIAGINTIIEKIKKIA